MIVNLNQDVPDAILDVLYEIDYTRMTRGEYSAALRELEQYIDRRRYLPKRRTPIQQVSRTLPNALPVEAIDLINSYDYRDLKSWQIKGAVPFVRAELRRRGLIMS